MADFIVIELANEEELLLRLSNAVRAVENPQAMMEAIGARLKSNVEMRFETKTDPNGQAWAPLSDRTPELYWTIDKERRGKLKKDAAGAYMFPAMPGSLLQRTGLMLQSLSYTATSDTLDLGFARPYAIYHETGTKRNEKPFMPRRGMLFGDPKQGRLGDGDRQDVIDELEEFIADALGG